MMMTARVVAAVWRATVGLTRWKAMGAAVLRVLVGGMLAVEMAVSAVAVAAVAAVVAAAVAAVSLASMLPLLPLLTLATGRRLLTNWERSFKRALLLLRHHR